MKQTMQALREFQAAGDQVAIATVVATNGSTYRKPGAHMVLSASGALAGSVSGGCLEDDLRAIALEEVLPKSKPRLVVYNTRADEDLVWGLNMGCNGIVEVWLEPAPRADDPLLTELWQTMERQARCALVTVVDGPQPGGRMLVHTDGSISGSLGEGLGRSLLENMTECMGSGPDSEDAAAADLSLTEAVRKDALEMLKRSSSATLVYGADLTGRPSGPGDQSSPGAIRIYIESVEPSPRLFVFGGGHDAIPMVETAARAGWSVTVVDHRPAMLQTERFPRAERMVQARAEEAVAAAGVTEDGYAVVMTHNYGYDKFLLRDLCAIPAHHIGMLGPRERTESLLFDLAAEGFEPSTVAKEAIASPLGLDLGGEGPEEIAVSAVAELQAVRYGREAGRLRERKGPIHPRQPR